MFLRSIILQVLILMSTCCVAQEMNEPYLLLKKAGTVKQVIYLEGEEIRFQMRGEDHFRKALIQGFRTDTVRFHYFDVALKELEVIDIRGKRFQNFHFSSGGDKVIAAGVLFLVGDYVNQKLIQDEPGGLSTQTWVITGSIIGAGYLLKLFHKKKFRPGGRYILDIIDLRSR